LATNDIDGHNMKIRKARVRKDGFVQHYWIGNVEKETEKNKYFRKVIYTGDREQLVVMSIPVGGEIGMEMHHDVDQFFRVESGTALFIANGDEKVVGPGGSAVIGHGVEHNVVNIGKKPLKLYTVYSPPNHPKGTIDKTRMDAILREVMRKR
jgi:mannose-6-phosphate isomerase-like protein (cupin superfamily)